MKTRMLMVVSVVLVAVACLVVGDYVTAPKRIHPSLAQPGQIIPNTIRKEPCKVGEILFSDKLSGELKCTKLGKRVKNKEPKGIVTRSVDTFAGKETLAKTDPCEGASLERCKSGKFGIVACNCITDIPYLPTAESSHTTPDVILEAPGPLTADNPLTIKIDFIPWHWSWTNDIADQLFEGGHKVEKGDCFMLRAYEVGHAEEGSTKPDNYFKARFIKTPCPCIVPPCMSVTSP